MLVAAPACHPDDESYDKTCSDFFAPKICTYIGPDNVALSQNL